MASEFKGVDTGNLMAQRDALNTEISRRMDIIKEANRKRDEEQNGRMVGTYRRLGRSVCRVTGVDGDKVVVLAVTVPKYEDEIVALLRTKSCYPADFGHKIKKTTWDKAINEAINRLEEEL